jgi:hypothetical protein
MPNTQNSDYLAGFNDGYERGANIETRNIRGAYERMQEDFIWALFELELITCDPSILELIGRLRAQYHLLAEPRK